ncbi:predicted protein [Plenodomus lingam JN3]|uniref:Predicted protein n=1 Tax=Leptosphaeria maculans (strain JN3 / isolate v23.1.3 / race Av1-4-5-6-7-8) TaxID=985895 RepID=E4ZSM7_LEPMJ|nr:predicted protein [Plenodomus lingam JN3]CBX94407.1 predicted protein [Plenodomus lingam JN3]
MLPLKSPIHHAQTSHSSVVELCGADGMVGQANFTGELHVLLRRTARCIILKALRRSVEDRIIGQGHGPPPLVPVPVPQPGSVLKSTQSVPNGEKASTLGTTALLLTVRLVYLVPDDSSAQMPGQASHATPRHLHVVNPRLVGSSPVHNLLHHIYRQCIDFARLKETGFDGRKHRYYKNGCHDQSGPGLQHSTPHRPGFSAIYFLRLCGLLDKASSTSDAPSEETLAQHYLITITT